MAIVSIKKYQPTIRERFRIPILIALFVIVFVLAQKVPLYEVPLHVHKEPTAALRPSTYTITNLILILTFIILGAVIARQQLETGTNEASAGGSALERWFVGGGILSLACWLAAVSLTDTRNGLLSSSPMMNFYVFGTTSMLVFAIGFYGFSKMIDRRIKARMDSGHDGVVPMMAGSVAEGRKGVRRVIWIAAQGAATFVILYIIGLVAHIH